MFVCPVHYLLIVVIFSCILKYYLVRNKFIIIMASSLFIQYFLDLESWEYQYNIFNFIMFSPPFRGALYKQIYIIYVYIYIYMCVCVCEVPLGGFTVTSKFFTILFLPEPAVAGGLDPLKLGWWDKLYDNHFRSIIYVYFYETFSNLTSQNKWLHFIL
jgi:hypothetical protein